MPVTYDGSSLLKCSVQMTYMRYVMKSLSGTVGSTQTFDPFQQSQFNSNGLTDFAANVLDNFVDRATGSDALGDIAGGLARRFL